MSRPPTIKDVRVTFEADVESIRSARETVAEALVAQSWPPAAVDRARLVVSELAANAVLHARTRFELHCALSDPDQARLEVTDWAPGVVPRVKDLDRKAPGGMGLRLIDAMTAQWGVEEHPQYKVVWCQMDPTTGAGAHISERREPGR